MQAQNTKRAAKSERRDKVYGTLEAFPEFFEKFTPPAGSFDPRSAWNVSYGVWLFAGEPGAVGFLEIGRQPTANGSALQVATRISQFNGYQQQSAALECAADTLSSLRSLQLDSVSGTSGGQPLPDTKTSVRVQVRGDIVEFARGMRKRTARVTPPITANWGLLDAVQRLSPDQPKPLEFTLLDDGDLLKPAQRLTYTGKTAITVSGGAQLALHCWEQIGSGVLPTHYWTDEQSRLLFAVAGQRAYLYDPGARQNIAGRRKRRQQ